VAPDLVVSAMSALHLVAGTLNKARGRRVAGGSYYQSRLKLVAIRTIREVSDVRLIETRVPYMEQARSAPDIAIDDVFLASPLLGNY
jgi:hypothetical protein